MSNPELSRRPAEPAPGTPSLADFLVAAEALRQEHAHSNFLTGAEEQPAQTRHILASFDQAALCLRLQSQEPHEMVEAVRELYDSLFVPSRHTVSLRFLSNTIEVLLARVDTANHDGTFTPLMESLARAVNGAEHGDFQNWSHSMCHIFESFGGNRRFSILDRETNRPAAQLILDEAVQRAVEGRYVGCVDRLLGGLLRLNLARVDTTNLDAEWHWRPESLSNPALAPLFAARQPEIALFLTSRTPREYFTRLGREVEPSAVYSLSGGSTTLGYLHEVLGATEPATVQRWTNAWLRENIPAGRLSPGTMENFAAFRSQAVHADLTPGIFVDVEGTILGGRDRSPGELNSALVSALRYCTPREQRITVITGGDALHMTELLRAQGVPEGWLPVRSKEEFAGQRLEYLIDDTPAGHQAFRAEREFRSVQELLTRDPWGILARLRAQSPLPASEA